MNQDIYAVRSNEPLTDVVYKMVLAGPTESITAPGQFLNIKLDGMYLRRPISISDWDDETVTIIYKTVGKGTDAMSELPAGITLDILNGLGNGYDTSVSGQRPLLIGGGVGVPPLFGLCKKLVNEGKQPTVVLGFNTAAEIFLEDEFRELLNVSGGELRIAVADGSAHEKGFVTDVIKDLEYTYFYTCGPMPMFRAVENTVTTSGQYSMEERMGCGFGACMGCSIETANGPKRVCKDGPVFRREEILW